MINLFCIDYTFLYFQNITCRLCWPNYDKITRFFEIGREKISKELDILKIVKKLRKVSIMLKL